MFALNFLTELAQHSIKPSSLNQYRHAFNKFYDWFKHSKHADPLHPTTVEHYIFYLHSIDSKKSTFNTFTAMINMLIELYNIASPITPLIRRAIKGSLALSQHQAQQRWFLPEHILPIINNTSVELPFRFAIATSWFQLLRISEVLRLNTFDFDLPNNKIIVRPSKRSNSPIECQLHPTVKRLFKQLKPQTTIFPNAKPYQFNNRLKSICIKYKLPVYTWHALRHGGATAYSKKGIPKDDLMKIGRWKSVSAMQLYIHN